MIRGAIVERDLADRVVGRELLGHDHRAGGKPGGLTAKRHGHGLAADVAIHLQTDDGALAKYLREHHLEIALEFIRIVERQATAA